MADGEERQQNKIANVLVFAPPKICFHQPYKKLRIENKDSQDCWDKTTFHFFDATFVKTLTKGHDDLENTETSEESCIFLEYDPKLLQESVNSYLDQVFSESTPCSFSVNDSCCVQNKPVDTLSGTSTELQKEYDTVNYESQVLLDSIIETEDSLLMKEKQRTSENTSTRDKLVRRTTFSRKRSKAESKTSLLCFEDTHPMSEEDVYTQQKTQASETNNIIEDLVIQIKDSNEKAKLSLLTNSSSSSLSSLELPSKQSSSSLSLKLLSQKASSANDQQFCQQPAALPRSSSELSKHQQSSSTKAQSLQRSSSESFDSKSSKEAMPYHPKKQSRCLALPKISDKLSNLSVCAPGKELVNICILVLQVNPIKEIQIKSGQNAGQFIPLSSIIVSDTTKSHFKLTLWRKASSWTEKMVAGDIIVATAIRIEKWRDEYIGQTTFTSSLYNLHWPQKPLSSAWLQIVSQPHLDELMSWARNVYGYLFRKSPSTPTVKFVHVSELQDNTLVHFRGLLKSVCVLTDKSNRNTYRFGTQRLPKIRAVFAQSPKEDVCVTLWGRQADWLNSLRKSEGSVFELRYLTAKYDSTTGNMTLHTTPTSTKNRLDADNETAMKLLSLFKDIPVEITTCRTIKHLLQAKLNGYAEISGSIHSFLLRYESDSLEVKNRNIEALREWCNRLTYVGCASCSLALKQDKNGIYGQCVSCFYRKPSHSYAVKRYFRNIIVQVKDRNNVIDVAVHHKAACKLFEGMNPYDFRHGEVSGGSLSKVQELVVLVKELLCCKTPCRFVISCKTVVDDNSFVVSREFDLIDFKKK